MVSLGDEFGGQAIKPKTAQGSAICPVPKLNLFGTDLLQAAGGGSSIS